MANKFKTKKEWEAAADKMFADGSSPQEINKKLGTYSGPEGTFTIQQAAKSKRGFTVVDKDKRGRRNAKRKLAIQEQNDALEQTLIQGGKSESEARLLREKENAGYERIEKQAKKLNKEFGKGSFNAGHGTAALEGGGNFGRNVRLEIGKSRTRADGTVMRGNQSRGRIDETPDNVKPMMGQPRSGRGGRDTGLHILLEEEFPKLMDTGLTPQDRQAIRRDPSSSNDVFARRQRLRPDGGFTRAPGKVGKAGLVAGTLSESGNVIQSLLEGNMDQAGKDALQMGINAIGGEMLQRGLTGTLQRTAPGALKAIAPVARAAGPLGLAIGAVDVLDSIVEGATGRNLQETGQDATVTRNRVIEEQGIQQMRRLARRGQLSSRR